MLINCVIASLTTLGLKGGWISLFWRRSQSMRLKKACSRMSLSPSGPQPRRLDGCLVISCSSKDTKRRTESEDKETVNPQSGDSSYFSHQ